MQYDYDENMMYFRDKISNEVVFAVPRENMVCVKKTDPPTKEVKHE